MAEDSIIKIGVIGAESTGKTWLCEELAKQYNTVWVPEYAREYFNDSDIYNYSLDDLIQIAKKQISLEQGFISKADTFLFCDTTLITLKIWAELEFQKTPKYIDENLKSRRCHHYLITDNSIPWEKDPQRQNKFSRDLILRRNVEEVEKLGIDYTLITGIGKERVQQACTVLEKLF